MSERTLQSALNDLTTLVDAVLQLEPREQASFATLAEAAIVRALGPAIVIAEAERLLETM